MTAKRLAMLGLLTELLRVAPAGADVPNVLHYQGLLTMTDGMPVHCTIEDPCSEGLNLTFRIYQDAEGGDALWTETHSDIAVNHGILDLLMGETVPIPVENLGDPTYLGIEINGRGEMVPRQKMVSTAFSLQSQWAANADVATNAEHLAGRPAVEYVLVDELAGLCVTDEELRTVLEQSAGFDEEDLEIYLTERGYVPGPRLSAEDVLRVVAEGGFQPGPHFSGLWADLLDTPEFSAVAFSGELADLQGVGQDLLDGDDDLLAALQCVQDQHVKWDDGAWSCGDPDRRSAEVLAEMLAGQGFVRARELADVATSGAFTDLDNIPDGLRDGDDDTQLSEERVDEMVADNGYALSAQLSDIATTGSYADLEDIPDDLADGDDDALAALDCADGESPVFVDDLGAWACGGGSSLSVLSTGATSVDSGDRLALEAAGTARVVQGWVQDATGRWVQVINDPTSNLDGNPGCAECGDGSDGEYSTGAVANAEIAGGEYDFTGFTVVEGATLVVTGDSPLIIRSQGAVSIAGTLSLQGGAGGDATAGGGGDAGQGTAGGYDGGEGRSGVCRGGIAGDGPGGGAGGVNPNCGQEVRTIAATNPMTDAYGGWYAYSNVSTGAFVGGSGGGSGGTDRQGRDRTGGGGGGGGAVLVVAPNIVVSGVVDVRAGGGGCMHSGNSCTGGAYGGGGAGGGGSIWFRAAAVAVTGQLQLGNGILRVDAHALDPGVAGLAPYRGAKEGIAPLFALVQTVEGNVELQNNSNNVQEMRLDMLYSE